MFTITHPLFKLLQVVLTNFDLHIQAFIFVFRHDGLFNLAHTPAWLPLGAPNFRATAVDLGPA